MLKCCYTKDTTNCSEFCLTITFSWEFLLNAIKRWAMLIRLIIDK